MQKCMRAFADVCTAAIYRRRMRTILTALTLVLGCLPDPAGNDTPPSCQQALTHYYGAGCGYTDTSTGQPIALADMIGRCHQVAAIAPVQCENDLDNWLFCNNEVPTPSTTNAQCDCSPEYMALIQCE